VDFPVYDGTFQPSRASVVQGMKDKYQEMYRITDADDNTKIYGWQHLYTSILHYPLPESGGTAYTETTNKMTACGETDELKAIQIRCPDPTNDDLLNLWPKCRTMLRATAVVQNLASALAADVESASLLSNIATDFTPLSLWALGLHPLGTSFPDTHEYGGLPVTESLRFGSTAMCNPCWAGKEVLMQKMRIGSIANTVEIGSIPVFPEPDDISGEIEIIYTSGNSPCQWGLGGSQVGTDPSNWAIDCVGANIPTISEPSAWSASTRTDDFDDNNDLVNWNWSALALAYAAAEDQTDWGSHADSTMDHPLRGNQGMCARLDDSVNRFGDVDDGLRMTTLAKACIVSTYMAQATWNATKRIEAASSESQDAVTCTDENCMKTLVESNIVQPLKDTYANNVSCKLLHNSVKSKITRGLCLGTMVESGRVGWDARWIGSAFFFYTFASWLLWRRVRDNVKVQHQREKRAMENLEYMKEMEADGYGAIITEEERAKIMGAVDAVQKHREHMIGAASGQAWKGIHKMEGVGKDVFKKGYGVSKTVGGAVVAKGLVSAGSAATAVKDKVKAL